MEGSQKTKDRTTIWPEIPLVGIYLKNETKQNPLIQKDTCTLMLIAAQFFIISKMYYNIKRKDLRKCGVPFFG